MKRRISTIAISLVLAFSLMLPASAGGWVNCAAWMDGVRTWGWSQNFTTHGHWINGWITYIYGEYTVKSHREPPAVDGWNAWDVTNAQNEGASCYAIV